MLGLITTRGGDWLLGEKNYRFRISAHPPAKDFWSIVIYDNWSRAILANGQKVASKNSYDKAIQANADGTIDIYFGAEPPAGKESNWIRSSAWHWVGSRFSVCTVLCSRGSTAPGRRMTSSVTKDLRRAPVVEKDMNDLIDRAVPYRNRYR